MFDQLRGAGEVQDSEIKFGGVGGKRTTTKKKMKNSIKRRFSEDQVKWLESMFQNETKLEPRQKAEVASQLGLHPRQVAIWFQNKRARWKSKQLQQDFDVLRRNYDALASRFDLLERDNHSLSLQLKKLKELVGNNTGQEDNKLETGVNDQESESNNNTTSNNQNNNKKMKKKKSSGAGDEKAGLANEGGSDQYTMGMSLRVDQGCSDQNTNYFSMEEEEAADFLAMVEPACSSLTSDDEWHGLFDQSPTSCEWWDFWS